MAEPVFAFQLPDIDLRLTTKENIVQTGRSIFHTQVLGTKSRQQSRCTDWCSDGDCACNLNVFIGLASGGTCDGIW